MSSTNKTANYELSQFVGTDIPSILSDYNGDMRKIDAGIAEVATSAGSSASAVSALAGRVTTAENSITSLNGALEVTNQRSIQNQTSITSINSKIPDEASAENLLATVSDVGDVVADVKDIKNVIPANASEENMLATMSDVNGTSIKSVTISKNGHSTYASLLGAVRSKIVELGLLSNPAKLIGIEETGYCFYSFEGIDDSGSDMHFVVNKDNIVNGNITHWLFEIALNSTSSKKFDFLTSISSGGASNYTINDDTQNAPYSDFKIHYFE